MRYFLPFLGIILLSFWVSPDIQREQNNDVVNDFDYEHVDIKYEEIKSEHPEKIKTIDIKENEVVKQKPPRWRRVYYGNIMYAVDSNGLYHDRQGRVWKPIIVDTTAYTWTDDGYDPTIGAGDGKTATGKDAIRTYGIASGSPKVPMGSVVHVSGYGPFKVDDTGGRLKRDWRNKGIITLDLRIPQLRYDGAWRSVKQSRVIALKHGRRRNRLVLILLK